MRKSTSVLSLPDSILEMKRVSCLDDEGVGSAVESRQSPQAFRAEVALANEEIGRGGAVRNL